VHQTDKIEITDELIKTLKNNVEEINGKVNEKSPKLKKK
jgi:hypothetical protein